MERGGYFMTESQEPIHDIAQLGHVEIFSTKPDESVWFFKEILGMEETDRQGQSVYMRAWGDYDHCTLKITECEQAGLGAVGFRTWCRQALVRRVQALEAVGCGKGWIDGDIGHGRAYQFYDPDGHLMEVYYDVQKYVAPPHLRPKLLNQPQKFTGRGTAVKRIDHVNMMSSRGTPNREFVQNTLGFHLRENLQPEVGGGEEVAWLIVTSLLHETSYTRDCSA